MTTAIKPLGLISTLVPTLGAGAAAPLHPLSAFSAPNTVAQHLLRNPAVAFRQHPLFTPLPDERLFSVRIADNSVVSYTRGEFADLLRDLHAHDFFAARAKGDEIERIEHPDIPGLEIRDMGDFRWGDSEKRSAARDVTWSVREGVPPTVLMEKEGVALIDVEAVPADLMVCLETERGVTLVRGIHNGRTMIFAVRQQFQDDDHVWLRDWFQKHDLTPNEVVTINMKGLENRAKHGDPFLPGRPGVTAWVEKPSFVLVDAEGYGFLTDGRFDRIAWKTVSSVPTTDAAHASEPGINLKSVVEGIMREAVTQGGWASIAPGQLSRIYEAIANDEAIRYLQKLFTEGFYDNELAEGFIREGQQERLKAELWPHAFSLIAAPHVLSGLAGNSSHGAHIGRLSAYYYAFTRMERTIADIFTSSALPHFLHTVCNKLKNAALLNDQDSDFLSSMIANINRSGRRDNGLDHDDHVCVRGWFGRYTAFPFRYLQHRFNLLSVVGGYGHEQSSAMLKVIRQQGWRGLVIAEHLRGKGDKYGIVGTYEEAAPLAARFGFEVIGEVLSLDKNMDDHVRSGQYLLPAIEHLVNGREDQELHREGALVIGFLEQYERFYSRCGGALYALVSLVQLISRKEDLDPERKGSLGNLLFRIQGELKGQESNDGLLRFGIPAVAHLVTDLSELDVGHEGSVAQILIENARHLERWCSDVVCWSDIAAAMRFVRSKGELMELLDSIPFWNASYVNVRALLDLIKKRSEAEEHESGLSPELTGRLVSEIARAKCPTYTVLLKGALGTRSLRKDRYQPLRAFLADNSIDVNMRMNVLGDYSELLQLDDALHLVEEWSFTPSTTASEDGLDGLLNNITDEINLLLDAYRGCEPAQRMQRSTMHAKISRYLNKLRYALVREVLGRELTEDEKRLLTNGESYARILRLVSLAYTIANSKQGALARVIVKQALGVFFANYDPKVKDGESKAIAAMNHWLYTLGRKKKGVEAIYRAVDRRMTDDTKTGHGNFEIRKRLRKEGYHRTLWTKGVDIEVNLAKGLTEEEKREQIRTATFELMEIALMLGVEKYEGRRLTLDDAGWLDSYPKAFAFVEHIRRRADRIGDDLKDRLRLILESVRDMEDQVISPDVPEAIFRATIKKDLFTEAYAGVGVPGCFNPRGIHKEMPFVHATEANSGFLQVFNARGDQVANAVVVYADDGAYIYPGYNSSSYNMDEVYGEALKELSKLVPAIYLSSSSAGLNALKAYSTREQHALIVPPAIITKRYYDSGKIAEDDHALTIEENFYAVTEASIRQGNGFAHRSVKAELSNEGPDISWQALADQFLEPDYESYPFLRELDPKALLRVIGALKSGFMAGGWTIADDRLYDEIGGIVGNRLEGVSADVKDGVADMMIDFLTAQNWPIVDSSQPNLE